MKYPLQVIPVPAAPLVGSFGLSDSGALVVNYSDYDVTCVFLAPSGTEAVRVLGAVPMATITTRLHSVSHRFEVAKRVVRALRRKGKYMDIVLEYSQGGLSEEEFKASVSGLAVPFRLFTDKHEVLHECEVAWQLAGEDTLDAEELGTMLDLDPVKLDEIIRDREHAAPSRIDTRETER